MNVLTDAPKTKGPLSQAPAKRKLLIAGPMAALFGVFWFAGIAPNLSRMLVVFLGAYAIVGLIEMIGGQSLANMAKGWDQLAGWKKFLISIAVIVAAGFIFLSLMGLIAESIEHRGQL